MLESLGFNYCLIAIFKKENFSYKYFSFLPLRGSSTKLSSNLNFDVILGSSSAFLTFFFNFNSRTVVDGIDWSVDRGSYFLSYYFGF